MGASEKLGQCACAGLTTAVTKISDFTNHLCNGDIRDEKLFFDIFDKLKTIIGPERKQELADQIIDNKDSSWITRGWKTSTTASVTTTTTSTTTTTTTTTTTEPPFPCEVVNFPGNCDYPFKGLSTEDKFKCEPMGPAIHKMCGTNASCYKAKVEGADSKNCVCYGLFSYFRGLGCYPEVDVCTVTCPDNLPERSCPPPECKSKSFLHTDLILLILKLLKKLLKLLKFSKILITN